MKKTTVYSLVGAALFGTMLAVTPNNVHAASTASESSTVFMQQGTVKLGAATKVYATPNGKATGKVLPAGSTWHFYKSEDNGELWFNLGGSQWVSSTSLNITSNQKTAVKQTTTTKKTTSKSATTTANVEIKGKKTIAIKAGTPVYRTPDSKTPTSKTLKAGSSYRSYGSLDNGYLWYHLGGNQWIIANVANGSMKDPSTVSKTPAKTTTTKTATTKTTTKQSGTPANTVIKERRKLAIKAATTVYSQPSVTSAVKKTLNPGGSYVTYESIDNGYLWYNLGGDQWVIATVADGSMQDPAVKTSSSAMTEVRSYHGIATISYVPGKGLSAYTSPVSGQKVSGLKLTSGSKWRVYGQAKANGELWFNLGGSQWIQARYTNFKATK